MTRVPLVTTKTASGEVEEVLQKLESAGVRLNLMRAVANSNACFRNFMRLGNALMKSSLAPRLRELVILHVAKLADAPYVWQQHEPAARAGGVTDAEIDALASGTIPSRLDPAEAAALRFSTSAVSGAVSDHAFAAAGAHFDAERLVDLTMTVAWWGAFVPILTSALAVDLEGQVDS